MNTLPVPTPEPSVPYLKVRPTPKHRSAFAGWWILFLAVAMITVLVFCADRLIPGGLFSHFRREKPEETSAPEESTTDLYAYDAEAVPEGAFGVRPCDRSIAALGVCYENEADIVLPQENVTLAPVAADGVSVLIDTTHPYETYADADFYRYADGASFGSGEASRAIGVVAEAFRQALAAQGITAALVETNVVSGKNSYATAEAALRDALVRYPETQYIFDLHRAILLDEDGTMLRPVYAEAEQPTAQLRFLVGTDHENWEANFSAADVLTDALTQSAPASVMPTKIVASRLNQHVGPISFTVEVGACGNSVGEASRAAEHLAEVFASLVKK